MTTRGAQILVIEDRHYVRQLLLMVLQDFGYRPVGFGSAIDALAKLPELDPQLILLDMDLPGMNGREFLERIRATSDWATVPVMIISGLGDCVPPSPDRSLAVLAKPFDNTTLVQWVEMMLRPPATLQAAPAV